MTVIKQIDYKKIFYDAAGHPMPVQKAYISPGDLKRSVIAGNLDKK